MISNIPKRKGTPRSPIRVLDRNLVGERKPYVILSLRNIREHAFFSPLHLRSELYRFRNGRATCAVYVWLVLQRLWPKIHPEHTVVYPVSNSELPRIVWWFRNVERIQKSRLNAISEKTVIVLLFFAISKRTAFYENIRQTRDFT